MLLLFTVTEAKTVVVVTDKRLTGADDESSLFS